ncbi:MAG: acetyltransferase [Nitrospirota bacterium]
MKKIILLGGGGHARVLIDLIIGCSEYDIAGILDPQIEKGTEVSGIIVLGSDDMLSELFDRGIKDVCIAVGSIKDNNKRWMLYEKVKQIGFSVPALIHPKAVIAGDLQISEGVQIMAGSVIQTGSSIGENTIINTGAVIDHDNKVGRHVHICPGAVVSGGCIINDSAFIGAGATVIQGIRIGKNAIVAAGSVVINDVPDNSTVIGVPAK